MNVDLSIILPTFNRLPYLQRAVINIEKEFRSLSHEVLVVLGKDDDSFAWLTQFKDSYPSLRLVEDELLQGNSAAIMQCVPLLQGDYVMITSDHLFHLGEEFPSIIRRLSKGDLSAIFLKYYRAGSKSPYRIFVGRKSKSYMGNPMPKILVTPEAAVYVRKDFTKYFLSISTDFRNYGWGICITIRLLLDGRKVAHARAYTTLEIPIYDPDDRSHQRRQENESRRAMDQVYAEFSDVGTCIYDGLSFIRRLRVRAAQESLHWINRVLNKPPPRLHRWPFKSRNDARMFDRLIEAPDAEEEPSSVRSLRGPDQSIDRRFWPRVTEPLFDCLYGMCSAHIKKDSQRCDTVFLIQQLPEHRREAR